MKFMKTLAALAVAVVIVCLFLAAGYIAVPLAVVAILLALGFGAGYAAIGLYDALGRAKMHHAQSFAVMVEASKVPITTAGLALPHNSRVQIVMLPQQQPAQVAGAAPAMPELPAPEVASAPIPKMVDLLPALNQFKAAGLLNPARLDLLLGVGPAGAPVVIPLHDFMHGGGLGTTGSGKSSQQRSIITQMLLLAGPSNQRKINLFLFDLEGRELALFRGAGPTEFYTEDVLEAADAIHELRAIVERNARLTEESVQDEPYTLVAIEELLDFIGALPKPAREDLDFIMRRGRKSRVYVMGASQFFQVSQVGKALKSMMNSRMCFNSEQEDGQAFGFKPQTLKLLTEAKGRFAYRLTSEEQGGLSGIAQAPFISAKAVKLMLEAGRPVEGYSNRPATATKPADPVEAQYRELPAVDPTLAEAVQAYRQGATTVREMRAALGCNTVRAGELLAEIKRRYSVSG